jgi:trans-aconitate methyltransferase
MSLYVFAGDIAFRFLNYVNSQRAKAEVDLEASVPNVYMDPSDDTASSSEDSELLGNRGPVSHVTVCDINQSMLDVGKARALDAEIYTGKTFVMSLAVLCSYAHFLVHQSEK